MGFSIYAWITIATVLVTFGILLFTKLRQDLVFLIGSELFNDCLQQSFLCVSFALHHGKDFMSMCHILRLLIVYHMTSSPNPAIRLPASKAFCRSSSQCSSRH